MDNSFKEVLAGISEPDHYYYDQINSVLDYIYEILEEKGLSGDDLNKALNLDQGQLWTDLLEADFYRGVTQIEVALKMQILVTTRKAEPTSKGEPQPSSLTDNLKPGKARAKTQTIKPEADKPKKNSRATNSNNHVHLKAEELGRASVHRGKRVRAKNKKYPYPSLAKSQHVNHIHLSK